MKKIAVSGLLICALAASAARADGPRAPHVPLVVPAVIGPVQGALGDTAPVFAMPRQPGAVVLRTPRGLRIIGQALLDVPMGDMIRPVEAAAAPEGPRLVRR